MDKFYPVLTSEAAWSLQMIQTLAAQNPGYFDDPECPYPEEVKKLFYVKRAAVVEDDDRWSELERQSRALYQDLTEARLGMNERDNAEKMAYFRTATSLLEKLVSIQERTVGLRQIQHFHSVVLQVMEDVLTAEQRTDVMTKLREAQNADL